MHAYASLNTACLHGYIRIRHMPDESSSTHGKYDENAAFGFNHGLFYGQGSHTLNSRKIGGQIRCRTPKKSWVRRGLTN